MMYTNIKILKTRIILTVLLDDHVSRDLIYKTIVVTVHVYATFVLFYTK